MSTFLSVVGFGLLGAVVSYLILLTLNRQLSWYLPSTSNARLSRELTQSLAVVEGLSVQYQAKLSLLDETIREVNKYLEDIEYSRTAITAVIEAQALKQFETLPHDMYLRILRDSASQLANKVVESLHGRLHTIGSEYVLLHSIDDHTIDVQLSAEHSDWQTLQEALKKVEKFRPKTGNDGNVSWIESQKQFNVYISKLGEALFSLKWNGNVTLRKVKGNELAI